MIVSLRREGERGERERGGEREGGTKFFKQFKSTVVSLFYM